MTHIMKFFTVSLLIISFMLISCTSKNKYKQNNISNIENLAGTTYGGSCDNQPPLFLDPDWTEEEAEIIRESLLEWEYSLNITVGRLDYSAIDCDVLPDTWVEGCIVKKNIDLVFVYPILPGIVIWKNGQGKYLRGISLHEFGHWFGIKGHIDNTCSTEYIMSRCVNSDSISELDIKFWERNCKI